MPAIFSSGHGSPPCGGVSTVLLVTIISLRCLYELGILSEASPVPTGHTVSTSSEPVKSKPFKLKATIPSFVEKMEGRKAYTCYKIKVTCQHQMGPEEQFFVERRYSDFHNFHLALKAKVTTINT